MKYEPMNEWMSCTNFSSSCKYVCQMCFQCMIVVHEMYESQMNKFAWFPLLGCEMLNLWCPFIWALVK
jgi:hypothetical protein